jgi:F-box-like
MLPDDVLLEMFDFYVDEDMGEDFEPEIIQEWITLAHVCRRWRSVVFQSPHRLNLRLHCTNKTPARDTLDIWPPLPLIIYDIYHDPLGLDNILAALECNDRVCEISLGWLSSPELEYVTDSPAMQKPFPELADLHFSVYNGTGPILPDSFLGGTAPRLRYLYLDGVPFPGLPKLLLSATHLVGLYLDYIPPSGYIPPEAMATSLSALTNLESLHLRFRSPLPRPAQESRRPPPLTRTILPSLTTIQFKGASEYLEEILARIDAPRLDELDITFFNQIIFDTPQLFQFISRRPTLRAPEKGHIEFRSGDIIVRFLSQTSDYRVLSVQIPCTASEWQLLSLGQVCTSSLPPVSTLEDLYIFEGQGYPLRWQDDVENTLWLELLHPFAAVKNLYLCERIMPRIAPALQELVGARTTEVLPTLENIFLKGLQPSGPLQEGIEKFVAARQLTSHPVAVSRWDWLG